MHLVQQLSVILLLCVCYAANAANEVELKTDASSQEQGNIMQGDPHELLLHNTTDWEIFPHTGLAHQFFNSSRRKLGSFQVCALCTCCGEGRRFCIPTACCYTITCGSPDRPFGLCSFTPMSCNCFSCHL